MNLIRCSAVSLHWMAIAAAWSPAAEPSRLVEKATANKTVRLLTIGNSFSHDATTFLGRLAAADGNQLILKTATIGGSPLQLHWDKAQLHERAPSDREGLYGNVQGLKEILRDGSHDFVTIQQRSSISHDAATCRPYAAKIEAYVKQQHAPEAELLLHETWAYRVDDRRFTTPMRDSGEPRTQREMYEQLAKAYRTIAAELGVRLIPMGDAFYAADTDVK